jgi:protocatechuate 3,4-dioxygenase, alpha subunit
MTDLERREPASRPDNQDPAMFGQTPSQTVGPFFHYGLPWKGGADLIGDSEIGARAELFPPAHYVLAKPRPGNPPAGEMIEIIGRVTDGDGQPVVDAMIEIWQANAAGRYRSEVDPRVDIAIDPAFTGFGRSSTDEGGMYRFRTILPGQVPGPGNGLQAPHIAISVFARGVLKRLATRLYFAGNPANADDPILTLVPDARRDTLLATHDGQSWRFDIVLQGPRETVFFDL